MDVTTACHKCHAQYSVDENYIGHELPCEMCGEKFVVLAIADGTDVHPGAATAEDALLISALKLVMLPVPPGSYRQGSTNSRPVEAPTRVVDIRHWFRMSKCPITQFQYGEIMNDNPSYFSGAELPVENITWNEANEFCRRVTIAMQAEQRIPESAWFRLPTEAEWEYACRTDPERTTLIDQAESGENCQEQPLYAFGNDPSKLNDYAWFADNSNERTHEVGGKKPNKRGFHDLHGNVGEWCQDWFGLYLPGRFAEPLGPDTGGRKVRRGGAWASIPERCRATDREGVAPDCHCALIGFRIVLVEHGQPPFALNAVAI